MRVFVDNLMKCRWDGDLVWDRGKAQSYSNVSVARCLQADLNERTWRWLFRSATVALELPPLTIRFCNHCGLQLVACKLCLGNHQNTANGFTWVMTYHPPRPNCVLLRTSPLENVCDFVVPTAGGEFHALIAPPG